MRFTFISVLLVMIMFSCKTLSEKAERPSQLRDYKLAMVQMNVVGGDQQQNLRTAENRIKEAADNGAQIALLPEALDFGWTHSSARQGAGTIPGGISYEALAAAAKANNIFVCAGIIERDNDKLYNSAVIIDREGQLVIRHRKMNELDFAIGLYSIGNTLNVKETELGTLGLLICADATAADMAISKSLGMMGADIILSPSAWAVPPDHNNLTDPYGGTWLGVYKPICKIFDVWYIGVSNVGTITDGDWKGWNCIGSSIAMDTQGEKVMQGPYGMAADTILYIDVKLKERPARGTQWYGRWRLGDEEAR